MIMLMRLFYAEEKLDSVLISLRTRGKARSVNPSADKNLAGNQLPPHQLLIKWSLSNK